MPKPDETTQKLTKDETQKESASGSSQQSTPNTSTGGRVKQTRARKRKRGSRSRSNSRKLTECELESELENCNVDDVVAMEKKLRTIAQNNDLNKEEMLKLLQKFVKNDHVLALVSLKAEEELQRDKNKETANGNEDLAVPKLTRAKARELKRQPIIALPSLREPQAEPEVAALVQDELHPDEDDEEYTFKEEDFLSDEEANTTASDMDSNPRTPKTPGIHTEPEEDTPVKFTPDGCFKIPLSKGKDEEDLRIATRTRSKLCLEQTTIEDLQSEFVPPDVDAADVQEAADATIYDEDWLNFLDDFSRPLNNSFTGDDDDPINDPEYVAAEKVPVDAEELRDVNISKKELADLVAELFDGLAAEGVCMDNVELATPQKFLENLEVAYNDTPLTSLNKTTLNAERETVTRQIDFDEQPATEQQVHIEQQAADATTANMSTSTSISQSGDFLPHAMSTPSTNYPIQVPIVELKPTGMETSSNSITLQDLPINTATELIAVPLEGQPNVYQLARVVNANYDYTSAYENVAAEIETPYELNYKSKYISKRKCLYSEYKEQFEQLKTIPPGPSKKELSNEEQLSEFSHFQHQLLQQQLCQHVQLLTQHYLQLYSHPLLWQNAREPREKLYDLKQRASTNASFNAWNLNGAVQLVEQWEQELSVDNQENKEMMEFLNEEMEKTSGNGRKTARFTTRIVNRMLNSTVFMYPELLPRVPFTHCKTNYHIFAPAEMQLIAMWLEKQWLEKLEKQRKPSLRNACIRMTKEKSMAKTWRRVQDEVINMRSANYYNPIKYFYEHGKAPPVECKLFSFCNNIVLPPRERFVELPLAWKTFLQTIEKTGGTTAITASARAKKAFLRSVQELVLNDDAADSQATVPDLQEAVLPTDASGALKRNVLTAATATGNKRKRPNKRSKQETVVINFNYVYSDPAAAAAPPPPVASITSVSDQASVAVTAATSTPPNTQAADLGTIVPLSLGVPVLQYKYDLATQTLVPLEEQEQLVVLEAAESNTEVQVAAAAVADAAVADAEIDSKQRRITDYFLSSKWTDIVDIKEEKEADKNKKKTAIATPKRNNKKVTAARKVATHTLVTYAYWSKSLRSSRRQTRQRQRQRRRQRKGQKLLKKSDLLWLSGDVRQQFARLLRIYSRKLKKQLKNYKQQPVLLYFWRNFKALDIYTSLLEQLKMFCKNATAVVGGGGAGGVAAATDKAAHSQGSATNTKRSRAAASEEEGASSSSRPKKINRQEENFRNTLRPSNEADAYRNDAIYAFNYYEKVEEVLKSSNRQEDWQAFNQILKAFNPCEDKITELYKNLEELFLPEHPELAQVFLTFLLPAEATEIGKFFEYFMASNLTTFISKLNTYFYKQPAQIRKVYSCLAEMAEEEDVTFEKVEQRISPLLKGNQFLMEWFQQLFEGARPPDRLLSAMPENVNLKETINNHSGEFSEIVIDPIDSPTQDQQACQLRYINGRIFYGSKILLPAKLTFLAQKHQADAFKASDSFRCNTSNVTLLPPEGGCVHAELRAHGEQHLAAAAFAAAAAATVADGGGNASSEDSDRIDDDDAEKSLVIDLATDEDSNPSANMEVCDRTAILAHARRLNPLYHCSNTFEHVASHSATQASTMTNAKKSDELKLSPRKQQSSALIGSGAATAAAHSQSTSAAQQRSEKRKSPNKKLSARQQPASVLPARQTAAAAAMPMVVIHNAAIACAKRLKSMVEEQPKESAEQQQDAKGNIAVAAWAKFDSQKALSAAHAPIKTENVEQEFLQLDAPVPSMREVMNADSTVNLNVTQKHASGNRSWHNVSNSCSINSTDTPTHDTTPIAAQQDNPLDNSDVDSKLNIVATLITSEQTQSQLDDANTAGTSGTANAENKSEADVGGGRGSGASAGGSTLLPQNWTRGEDKIVLVEMNLGSFNKEALYRRIEAKLPERTRAEIVARHQFLVEFLTKLQGQS